MRCVACGADHLKEFPAEINIHFSGLQKLDKPSVFVFPTLLVCLDCGSSRFSLAESELGRLASAIAGGDSSPTKSTPSRARAVAQDCG
jgi:hypothetical protein